MFYEKELQNTNQEKIRIGKVIKRKGSKLYVKWKGYDNSFKSLYKMSQYFPKPSRTFVENINVKVDLSNYATKLDLKSATWVDTSKLAAKFYLASLKAEIDKIDIDKLKTVPVYLSKLIERAVEGGYHQPWREFME